MKKEKNKKSITTTVVSKIEKEGLKMKSKFYFATKSALIVALLISLFSLLFYFSSLITFILKANDIFLFHDMGICAVKGIIYSFPWYLIFLIFTLIIIIEVIGKKFQFVYRKPLIFSLIAIILIVTASNFLIEKSSLHYSFFKLAEQEKLPLVGRMYRSVGNLDVENVYFGTIIEKELDLWKMELDSGEVVSLEIDERTKGRRFFPEIEEGKKIVVIGEREDDSVKVFNFKKIERRHSFDNYGKNER